MDNTVFKRNLREGIRYRPDLLDKANKQVNASMDLLRTTLSNVDAGRQRRQAEYKCKAQSFGASGNKTNSSIVLNKPREDCTRSLVQ